MRDLTWIKLVIGIFDDEKIKFIDTLEMRNLFICIFSEIALTPTEKRSKIEIESFTKSGFLAERVGNFDRKSFRCRYGQHGLFRISYFRLPLRAVF